MIQVFSSSVLKLNIAPAVYFRKSLRHSPSVEVLNKCLNSMVENNRHCKFSISTISESAGLISDYHNGLRGRIGKFLCHHLKK